MLIFTSLRLQTEFGKQQREGDSSSNVTFSDFPQIHTTDWGRQDQHRNHQTSALECDQNVKLWFLCLVWTSLTCGVNFEKTGGGHIFAQEKHKDLRVFWMKNPAFSDFPQIHPVPSGDANEDGYKFDVLGVLHFHYVPPTMDVTLYLVSVIFPSALLKSPSFIKDSLWVHQCVRCFWLYHTSTSVRGDCSWPTYLCDMETFQKYVWIQSFCTQCKLVTDFDKILQLNVLSNVFFGCVNLYTFTSCLVERCFVWMTITCRVNTELSVGGSVTAQALMKPLHFTEHCFLL